MLNAIPARLVKRSQRSRVWSQWDEKGSKGQEKETEFLENITTKLG